MARMMKRPDESHESGFGPPHPETSTCSVAGCTPALPKPKRMVGPKFELNGRPYQGYAHVGEHDETEGTMTPEEVLLEAVRDIETHGWHQGSYHRHDADDTPRTAPACALGAISRVLTGRAGEGCYWGDELATCITESNSLFGQAATLLADSLGLKYGNGANRRARTIPNWNDSPERTAEDVMLAMKKAAHHDG